MKGSRRQPTQCKNLYCAFCKEEKFKRNLKTKLNWFFHYNKARIVMSWIKILHKAVQIFILQCFWICRIYVLNQWKSERRTITSTVNALIYHKIDGIIIILAFLKFQFIVELSNEDSGIHSNWLPMATKQVYTVKSRPN